MSDLQRALEMVEASEGELPWLDDEVEDIANLIWPSFMFGSSCLILVRALQGSLTAAINLIDREMPGWRKQLFERIDDGVISWNARLISPRHDCFATDEDTEKPRTAALALMRVYLRARIAQSEQEAAREREQRKAKKERR